MEVSQSLNMVTPIPTVQKTLYYYFGKPR